MTRIKFGSFFYGLILINKKSLLFQARIYSLNYILFKLKQKAILLPQPKHFYHEFEF